MVLKELDDKATRQVNLMVKLMERHLSHKIASGVKDYTNYLEHYIYLTLCVTCNEIIGMSIINTDIKDMLNLYELMMDH